MFSPLFLGAIGTSGPDPAEWERFWRQHHARLVLNGITVEEHFCERAAILVQLLDGLTNRFRKVEPVSPSVLDIAAEVVEQIDSQFLGVEAWQRAQLLPERVHGLASIEVTKKSQSCLKELRKHMRTMKMWLPSFEKEPRLAVQYPDAAERLSGIQGEIENLFSELREQVRALESMLYESSSTAA